MNARQLAAVHEAGHVVARVVRGLPLPPLVEIREDGTGETHGTGEQVRFDPFGSAVVALAGYVAEHRASGCRYEWTPIAAALSDPGSDADIVRCLVRTTASPSIKPRPKPSRSSITIGLRSPPSPRRSSRPRTVYSTLSTLSRSSRKCDSP